MEVSGRHGGRRQSQNSSEVQASQAIVGTGFYFMALGWGAIAGLSYERFLLTIYFVVQIDNSG